MMLTEIDFVFGLRVVEGALRGNLASVTVERHASYCVVLMLSL